MVKYSTRRSKNAIVQSNPSGGEGYINNYRPQAAMRDISHPYSESTALPTSYVDASITQLLYTVNTNHNLLYSLSFTEAAGNFESNNDANGVPTDGKYLA